MTRFLRIDRTRYIAATDVLLVDIEHPARIMVIDRTGVQHLVVGDYVGPVLEALGLVEPAVELPSKGKRRLVEIRP